MSSYISTSSDMSVASLSQLPVIQRKEAMSIQRRNTELYYNSTERYSDTHATVIISRSYIHQVIIKELHSNT